MTSTVLPFEIRRALLRNIYPNRKRHKTKIRQKQTNTNNVIGNNKINNKHVNPVQWHSLKTELTTKLWRNKLGFVEKIHSLRVFFFYIFLTFKFYIYSMFSPNFFSNTVDSRNIFELGYLELCEARSVYLNQRYILIAFSNRNLALKAFLQVQITRSANSIQITRSAN